MQKKKKKILVTGSGGFVFSNFIRQVFFSKKPYIISSIDRVRESNLLHNIFINSDHSFYIGDIRDKHFLHVIFQKERPDVVIHGADENYSDSENIISSNILGTQNIIEECLKTNTKLIYISTDKIFGSLVEKTELSDEESSLNPGDLFSTTKATGEMLVKVAYKNYNLNFNILRLSNNYGPWQSHHYLIPKIIYSILNNKEILIPGQGNRTRDWTHVYDTCSAIFKILDSSLNAENYNITAKQEFMDLEVAQIVCNTMGRGHELLKHTEGKVNSDFRRGMKNNKILELGWKPEFKLREGIKQVCQWYISNKYVLGM